MAGSSVKNIFWSSAGLLLPLGIAALTVPPLIDRVGAERFGLLALAWGLVGYAGILDLGLGRAVTQRVAALSTSSTSDPEILMTLRSGLTVTKIAGFFGFLVLVLAAASGIQRIIPVTEVSEQEIFHSLLLLAFALPVQAMSATYRGVNEAYSNFVGISLLRIMLGVANFGGPFVVSIWTDDLAWLVSTLVVSRVLALFAYRALALRCLPASMGSAAKWGDRATMVSLLRFGGWVSVSNALSPVLVQADRFFIGVMISASAVTAYVIPYEIVVQCLVLVGAVMTVIFPVMSRAVAEGVARGVYRVWFWRVGVGMLMVTGALALVLPWILQAWVGERVPEESMVVGRILCVGVLLNSIGAVCFAYLHAHAEVRKTAVAHLMEVPLFLAALYLGITSLGIIGAAMAWVARVALDTGLLLWFVRALHVEEGHR